MRPTEAQDHSGEYCKHLRNPGKRYVHKRVRKAVRNRIQKGWFDLVWTGKKQ